MDDVVPVREVMLEFRAGKMTLEGTRVVPDTRKGLIRIGKGEEGLVHFQWIDRTTETVEDDQIIFPDEAIYEKVSQSSDRVYILKFNSDNRKYFFWMQERTPDGDSIICDAVNRYINLPLVEGEVTVPMIEIPEDMADDDFSSRDGNLVDQNIGELGGEVTSSAGPVQLSHLQRILRSIQPTDVEDPDAGLGLGDILKPDLILPIVEQLPLEQHLAPYLPEGSITPSGLIELLQSPQFRQQVDTFSHVLRTGQIDLSQFGINPAKYKFTVLSFLDALEDSVAKSSDEEASDLQRHGGDAMDES